MRPSLSSMRRTTSLALACAVLAASVARSQAPADSTTAPAPAVTTPVAAPAGKVTLRENLYYYDAFNHRDPFRSLVDGAFNLSDKMELVNLSAVQLVGLVRG